MLKLTNIHKRFGGNSALSGVDLEINQGEFVGLIGPNGSGKTTLINCISGMLKPNDGTIHYQKKSLLGLQPHAIYHSGIGRSFQIAKVFNRLNVLQNLYIPALTKVRLHRSEITKKAQTILKNIHLDHLAHQPAEKLSGGQRKLLEIGMIMMTDPDVLLLDEPFGGIHPQLKSNLEDYIQKLHGQGKTILLVSHEMTSVFKMCNRLTVMHNGTVIADGEPGVIFLRTMAS